MPKENPKLISKGSVMRNLKVAWQNKNFVYITIIQGIASLSWAMVMAIVFGYIKEVLHFSGILYYIAAVALLFGIMILWGCGGDSSKRGVKNGPSRSEFSLKIFPVLLPSPFLEEDHLKEENTYRISK